MIKLRLNKSFLFLLSILLCSIQLSTAHNATIENLYIDNIKKCLLDTIHRERLDENDHTNWVTPNSATMIGETGLNKIQFLVEDILKNNIPGDLIETGVWRGGATIFMRAILKAYQITNRNVWVADSFEGLPKPNDILYPSDKEDSHHKIEYLKVSLDTVKSNFKKYGLLDDQVKFLKGWFKDTLPSAPIKQLSLLRLDGDMYESTMDALKNLYHKLSIGGYIIIDDWTLPGAKIAVLDFRQENNITDEICDINKWTMYWQKTK